MFAQRCSFRASGSPDYKRPLPRHRQQAHESQIRCLPLTDRRGQEKGYCLFLCPFFLFIPFSFNQLPLPFLIRNRREEDWNWVSRIYLYGICANLLLFPYLWFRHAKVHSWYLVAQFNRQLVRQHHDPRHLFHDTTT